MAQRFERLRHHAVIRGDNEDNDVGDVRAARAHRAERSVTGRIKESDLREFVFTFRMRERNRVSADVLRDTAGFARGDVRFADDVQQRSFAVVDVTHDGHDRGAGSSSLGLVLDVQFDLFDRRVDETAAAFAFFDFELKSVFRANPLGDRFVNGLVDRGENAQLPSSPR